MKKDTNKFNKGEIAYIVDAQRNLIVTCTVLKESTEDKVSNPYSIETSKKPLWKAAKKKDLKKMGYTGVLETHNFSPDKMLFIQREGERDCWVRKDTVKKDPADFVIFL